MHRQKRIGQGKIGFEPATAGSIDQGRQSVVSPLMERMKEGGKQKIKLIYRCIGLLDKSKKLEFFIF